MAKEQPKILPLPEDRHQLVLDNMKLVHMTVRKYIHPKPQDYEDYVQEGMIGLILAARDFDPERGYAFSTYAVPQIIGYCRRYRRDKAPKIKYSRTLLDLYTKVAALQAQGLYDDEIMKRLDMGSSLYFEVINIFNVSSLDAPLDGEDKDSGKIQDLLGYTPTEYADVELGDTFTDALNRVVEKLSDKYKAIYEEYIYSLMYGEKLTQVYFSKKYGISQAQVSRILRKLNRVYQNILKQYGVDMP